MVAHAHEPHIICPKCSHQIPLTESIAAPLLEADRERKFMTKAWAKREAQVSAMIDSTVGLVGDLHGIMGQAMPEISAIEEPPVLEGKAA